MKSHVLFRDVVSMFTLFCNVGCIAEQFVLLGVVAVAVAGRFQLRTSVRRTYGMCCKVVAGFSAEHLTVVLIGKLLPGHMCGEKGKLPGIQ